MEVWKKGGWLTPKHYWNRGQNCKSNATINMMKIRVVLSMERINLLFKLKPHCVQLCNTIPPTPKKQKTNQSKRNTTGSQGASGFFYDTCTLCLT